MNARQLKLGALPLARGPLGLYFPPMHSCRLAQAVLVANLLVFRCAELTVAQSTTAVETAPLKAALVGDWVLDGEATADAFALAQFGPKREVVPNPKEPGQPQTFSTNITDRPFTWQEYAATRSLLLASLRSQTNEPSSRMTFASDGTGTNFDQDKAGSRKPVEHFKWVLEGHKLTITSPGSKTPVQTEFTNNNQLSLTTLRGIRIVLRPERPAFNATTNSPAAK